MAIFRTHESSGDRSATDRSRHKKKIAKALKEGIKDIVADETIIGQDGNKKIKVPVKGIKEYKFIYGENDKGVGSAGDQDIYEGKVIGKEQKKAKGKGEGDQAGNEKGEEVYEVEVTLDELAAYLFEDFGLPNMQRKTITKIHDNKLKRKGRRRKGIRPRLDKKKTLINKIKRKMITQGHDNDEESFSFIEKDLEYKRVVNTQVEKENAVVFFMMDTSGSMSKQKRYFARSFYFLLYQFLRYKYKSVDIVFIAHDIEAYEVQEDKFFSKSGSGGTFISSSYRMAKEVMSKRFPPEDWNIYIFHCSDGDNWVQDNAVMIDLIEELKPKTQLMGYCEIVPEDEQFRWSNSSSSTVYEKLEKFSDDSFRTVKISDKKDVWRALRRMFR